MENISEAFQYAFGVLVFMMATAILFNTVSLAMEVSTSIVLKGDKSEYYTYLSTDEQEIDANGNRIVTLEDIIPVLYRYYTESYGVTIIDGGNIVSRFDTTTERVCTSWGGLNTTSNAQALLGEINKYVLEPVGANLIGNPDDLKEVFQRIYKQTPVGIYRRTFSCPWVGRNEFVAQRIDSDLSRHTSILRYSKYRI